MVNSKSSSPGSPGVGSTPSAAPAGAGSTPSGSSLGGGSTSSVPPSGVPAATMPRHGFRDEVAAFAAAVGSQFPDGVTVSVAGQPMSKQSILSVLAGVQALFADVDAGVQSLKQKRLALTAALPGVHQFIGNLKAMLIGFFGKGNPVLESFGLVRKPRQLSAAEKTARAAKAKATRELRGTGGSRQMAAKKFTGKVEVQTTVSSAETAGGNAPAAGGSSAGASSSPTGSSGGTGSTAP